tara:strand:+ start:72 stop:566 length:495 start_codon:yes stop_codon:yes gene_type:complete
MSKKKNSNKRAKKVSARKNANAKNKTMFPSVYKAVQQTEGQPMVQEVIGKHYLDNGYGFQLVKYDDAENVVLMDVESGKMIENECMLGAIEVIIPERHNNTSMVKKLEESISKMFVNLQDAKWFKADKDNTFERKGDNVLEMYGHMRYDAAIDYIKTMAKLNVA